MPERAQPSGEQTKGDFGSYCCPQVFSDRTKCMIAWCPKCGEKKNNKRGVRSETGGGWQKRARAKESTTEVTHNLRGDCEREHTVEDMSYLHCNNNPKDLKKNRKGRGGKSGRLLGIHAGDVELDSSFYN